MTDDSGWQADGSGAMAMYAGETVFEMLMNKAIGGSLALDICWI